MEYIYYLLFFLCVKYLRIFLFRQQVGVLSLYVLCCPNGFIQSNGLTNRKRADQLKIRQLVFP